MSGPAVPGESRAPEQRRARLEALQDRFLAVSLRSRTLRLTRASKSGALDLTRLPRTSLAWLVKVLGSPTEPPIAPGVIADVLKGGAKAGEATLSEDVATLAHAARAVLMETGADELAVGFPFLEGRTADGTWLRAPLFLYPVAIGQTRTGKLRWTLQPTGAPWLNTALCETLRRLVGVRLTHEEFFAKDEDGLLKVDAPTWQVMVDTLRAAGLALDAPLSLPDAPSALEPRDEVARNAVPAGQFTLVFNLVLGRFPASGSTLVLDYEHLLAGPLDDAAVGLAAPILAVDDEGPEAVATDESLSGLEEEPPGAPHALGRLRRWQVLPSDQSQDDVFRFLEAPLTADTRGLVVQGPPGTGKSQLITNLLAAHIAEGQRVLLVCQKRAALDVVAERLERMGLREPVAVVHDVERDRNTLCLSIGETLTRLLDARVQGEIDPAKTVLDVDKAATRAGKDLAARLAGSQTAWQALTDEPQRPQRPALVALDEALLGVEEGGTPDLSGELAQVGLDDLPEGVRKVEELAAEAAPLAPPHDFAERNDWSSYDARELAALADRLRAPASELERWRVHAAGGGLTAQVLDQQRTTLAAAEPLARLAHDADLCRAHALFEAWHAQLAQSSGAAHGAQAKGAGAASEAIARRLRIERQSLPTVPPELVALAPGVLDRRIARLDRLAALQRRWWRVFAPLFWVLRGLPKAILADVRGPVRLGPSPALDLAQLHRDARRWQDFLADLPEHPILHLAEIGDPAALDRPLALLETGLAIANSASELQVALSEHGGAWQSKLALRADGGPSALAFAVAAELPRVAALAALDRALAALAPDFAASFLAALRQAALRAPEEAEVQATRLVAALPDAPACAALDRALAPLPGYARVFLRRYAGPIDGASEALRHAVAAGWRTLGIAHREPRAIERALLDPKLTAGLADALDEARAVAARGAHARWEANLLQAAADPGQRKELQKLLAEVTKRRNRQTLRQLQERHGARLGLVRPIWFCSPESVAALFPLEPGSFDLVIFDEASQCPVESAVPALVRGKRALIAGDDQQMPPSHFFQASLDDDALEPEESALLAAQSILGLARVALRTTTLSWHYRCRHEELIAFSNAAFYGRRLATAPNAERRARLASEGLHWEAVEGRWKDQMNPLEADRVVELIGQILSESMPDRLPPTVGIVAMNRPQAELIAQRVEARAADDDAFRAALQRDFDRPVMDQLFIRNLENVQGDERDIMILSLAYGPAEKGGKVHARFGPLGLEGGEKRLNVAITRARLGLWVVASCAPEDLSVAGTTHPGPKLLKAFLAFVRASANGEQALAKNLLDEAATLGRGKGMAPKTASPRCGTRLRDAIAHALEARGHTTQKDLGLGRLCLDLAVRGNGDDAFRVGLETSDYLLRRDPLLRELYVPQFWQRVGWKLVRVTPGAWRRDPKAVIGAIEKALG